MSAPLSQHFKALYVRHSLHEEYVAASLELPSGQSVDLGVRTHHQVLLELARVRLQDRHTGVSLGEEGWVHRDALTSRLGTDICNVNVMIHRARKQLRSQGVANGDEIIECRRGIGEVRLGVQAVKIDPL